jgi:phosphopantothenoylcysteine decarboxylase / phosphopantothenate---cysteine ligase
MDLDMLKHPATVASIEKLKSYGNLMVEPESGELASGLEGKGRMAEPEAILKEVISLLSKKKSLT